MSGVARAPATVLTPGAPDEVGMSVSRIQHIAKLGEQWVQEGVAPSLVLLVARRGRIVLHEAFGRRTPQPDAPGTPLDAIFPIASITKLFTATALVILVEEGRVGLNRPVQGYLPEFRGEGKDQVLVRHLLTHTSGVQEEALEQYANARRGKIDLPAPEETVHPLFQEYLALRYDCPLWKPPGAEMSYADFNFDLLAEIVRRVSRMPLDRLGRERIFQPLGMTDTYYCRVDAPAERRIQRAPQPAAAPDPLGEAVEKERLSFGSAYAVSTAGDLAAFGQMFLNGGAYGPARVLAPTSVAAMTRNQIPGISATFLKERLTEASWGFGWSVHGTKNGFCGGLYSAEAYEHWGSGGVYLWVDPSNEIVGVYLSLAPSTGLEGWTARWRHDLFTDAVTAAIVDP
jgi:serine-type D-Ala-D-Ala carboxypeptidase